MFSIFSLCRLNSCNLNAHLLTPFLMIFLPFVVGQVQVVVLYWGPVLVSEFGSGYTSFLDSGMARPGVSSFRTSSGSTLVYSSSFS